MERSLSCSSFEIANHPTSLLRQIGSNMPVQMKETNRKKMLATTANKDAANIANCPTATTLRRKTFQRQHSTTFSDDIDYAGDFEEEEDHDEDDETLHANYDTVMPSLPGTYARQRYTFQPTLPAHTESTYQANAHIVRYTRTSTMPAATMQRHLKHEDSFDSTSTTAGSTPSPISARLHYGTSLLMRDNSLHSDSSRYSSVDSLLEARKPDPEAILINLGFGPVGTDDILSRIPKRFLKPSQVRGNDTDAFVKRLQLASNLADHSALGYRGLTGNPDIPPSSIVAKIMHRFEVNERKKSMGSIEHAI